MNTLKSNITNTVKNLLLKIGKQKDINKIRNDSTLAKDLGIDSFGSIELISGLEDIFEINIKEKKFEPNLTVADIINYVYSKLNAITLDRSTIMPKDTFLKSLKVDKSLIEQLDFNPYYHNIKSGLAREITIQKKKYICLGSNDYLGIANNRMIKTRAIKIIEKYGMSMCGTPIVIGQTDINRKLELKIAKFLKQDDAIIYPSGYQCNISVFQLLANRDDIIIADKNIHSSLINGCRLTEANLKFFAHNDIQNLQTILNTSLRYRMRFIIIEGLYSTDGDIAPVDKIVNLAKEFSAFLIVDDAHGVGVLGKEGRGIIEKFNAYNDVDLITGSLGKALGGFGGFLAGKQKIIDYFKYSCPMYFYSTALPPYIAASAIVAIEFVKTHNNLRVKIFNYKDKIFTALKKMGYRLTNSTTPLFSILFNNSYETLKFAKLLFQKHIYVVPFIPPSVPQESPRIRLLASAYLRDEDINKVIKIFDELKGKYVK
jgi:glycine C-acetyltransferase